MLATAAVLLVRRAVDAPGPLARATDVLVPRGSTGAVARALADAGAIARPSVFRLQAELSADEGQLRAGEFALPSAASIRQVLAVLRTARPVQHRLTLPEGLTAAQLRATIAAVPDLDGPVPAFAEGALLPETYAFERGATRAAVVRRAETAMDQALAAAWAGRDPDLPLRSPQEALVLASIVERETARPEERAHAAAVFLNRLRLGMRLQSDPTVEYAASDGAGRLGRPLTRSDLDAPSPWNTYRVTGLPPGPIDSPGRAALDAVLHPADSQDLYFVADGTGGHAFARTLEEHTRNVARWRTGQAKD